MQVPKSIVIIGGGYIAVEFAGIFAGLGAEVHLVYRQDMPLRGFDEEVRCACCVLHAVLRCPFAAACCPCYCAAHAVLRPAAHGAALPALLPACLAATAACLTDAASEPPLPAHHCPLPACLQVRKFATEQYALNGLHLHPLSTPDQLTKLPDGRLLFKGARRAGDVSVWPSSRHPPAPAARRRPLMWG